jgi:hypothetical protein
VIECLKCSAIVCSSIHLLFVYAFIWSPIDLGTRQCGWKGGWVGWLGAWLAWVTHARHASSTKRVTCSRVAMECFDSARRVASAERSRVKSLSQRHAPKKVKAEQKHRVHKPSVGISSISLPPCNVQPRKVVNPSQSKTPVSLCAVNEPFIQSIPNEKSHDHPKPLS